MVLSAISVISAVAAISKIKHGFANARFKAARNIVVIDVTAVFAQMRGDAVSTRTYRRHRGMQRIGMTPAAGIADGSDVIDVHAKAQARPGIVFSRRAIFDLLRAWRSL